MQHCHSRGAFVSLERSDGSLARAAAESLCATNPRGRCSTHHRVMAGRSRRLAVARAPRYPCCGASRLCSWCRRHAIALLLRADAARPPHCSALHTARVLRASWRAGAALTGGPSPHHSHSQMRRSHSHLSLTGRVSTGPIRATFGWSTQVLIDPLGTVRRCRCCLKIGATAPTCRLVHIARPHCRPQRQWHW